MTLTPAEHVAPSPATTAPPGDLGSASEPEAPTPLSPEYYVEQKFNEDEWTSADGLTTTIERYPYWAIRERPTSGTDIGSHEIGQTHSKGWAEQIVAAMNALDNGAERSPSAEQTK